MREVRNDDILVNLEEMMIWKCGLNLIIIEMDRLYFNV